MRWYKVCKGLMKVLGLVGLMGNALWAATPQKDSLNVNGQWRYFWIYIPDAYWTTTDSVPLILNLHGYTSNAPTQMFYTGMNAVADTANFIVVYPQGLRDTFGNTYWNAGFSPYGSNDTLFLNMLIAHLLNQYRIAPDKVFMCGFSNGAIMSYYMACFANRYLRAIGPVGGSMVKHWMNMCSPSRPIPLIHIHGTADATVPYHGGPIGNNGLFWSVDVDSVLAKWRALLKCTGQPDSIRIDRISGDGVSVDWFRWSCPGYAAPAVELMRVNGEGHTWPGGALATQEISASAELWRFFRNVKAVPTTSIRPASGRGCLVLHEGQWKTTCQVEVYDLTGRRVKTYSGGSLLHLPAGIYWVREIQSGRVQRITIGHQ